MACKPGSFSLEEKGGRRGEEEFRGKAG